MRLVESYTIMRAKCEHCGDPLSPREMLLGNECTTCAASILEAAITDELLQRAHDRRVGFWFWTCIFGMGACLCLLVYLGR